MDFGFGRFLEMFEERFGRLTTTLLLAIIGLSVFGFCAKLVFVDILVPLSGLAASLYDSEDLRQALSAKVDPKAAVLSFIMGMGMGAACGIVLAGAIIIGTNKVTRRARRELEELLADIRAAAGVSTSPPTVSLPSLAQPMSLEKTSPGMSLD